MKSILLATIILITSSIYTPNIFAWDFSYSYSNPNDSEAQKYIIEKKNVAIHKELFDVDAPPVGYAWVPARGGASLATSVPGEITYHFHFDQRILSANLFMQVTSFNWSYSEGLCALYASSDGVTYTEIARAPTPENAGYNMGTYNDDLLQVIAGGHDIYLHVLLYSYGEKAHEGPPWTNTAQHSRYDPKNPKETFSLDVAFEKRWFSQTYIDPLIPGEPAQALLQFFDNYGTDIDGFLKVGLSDNGGPIMKLATQNIFFSEEATHWERREIITLNIPETVKGPKGVLLYTFHDDSGNLLTTLQEPVIIDRITDAKTFIYMLLINKSLSKPK